VTPPQNARPKVRLSEIVRQAAREERTDLAITAESSTRDKLVSDGWRPERAIVFSGGIRAEGVRALAQLSALTSLNLEGNDIGDEGVTEVAQLSRLTSLNLASNFIGDEGARALAHLSRLTSLDLGANGIGDAGGELWHS
jgi:Leucine-rich repeat (LRR) protein